MLIWGKGRYRTRIADGPSDLRAAQRLRYRAFFSGTCNTQHAEDLDTDAFDALCNHVLVEEAKTGRLVATFRLMQFSSGAEIGRSYSAQFYDLEALRAYDGPMAEIGRFCLKPGNSDPDILRAAWGALTGFVEREGIGMLFGCSSFQGTDAEYYADAFAVLTKHHLAPRRWLPRIKAPNVFRFAERLKGTPDRAMGLRRMPPLLRSYLIMGGWVSDHAVVDRELNTLHVFTGLEISAVPQARAQALRAVAG